MATFCKCTHPYRVHAISVEQHPCTECECEGFAPAEHNDIRLTVSMEQKINLGNYESASVFIGLSNIAADATAEQIDAALDEGRVVYDKIRARLKEQVKEARPW